MKKAKTTARRNGGGQALAVRSHANKLQVEVWNRLRVPVAAATARGLHGLLVRAVLEKKKTTIRPYKGSDTPLGQRPGELFAWFLGASRI